MHDWEHGTDGAWVSMAVPSDGSYGVPEGLTCGFPVECDGQGGWKIVQGLELDDFAKAKFQASVTELQKEKTVVADLLG